MVNIRFISFCFAACAFAACADVTLTVSPQGAMRSPADAVAQVRQMRAEGRLPRDATAKIVLEKGVYLLQEPIRLQPEDSNLLFEAGGEAIISGGSAIAGWREIGGGVWRAQAPTNAPFRQLTVNGVRAPRCRHPNAGCFKAAGEETPFNPKGRTHSAGRGKHPALVYDPKDVDFAALGDLSAAELRIFHWWQDTHIGIASVDSVSNKVWFTHPLSLYVGWHRSGNKPGLYRIENVRAFLDAPGEWYHDVKNGFVDYMPRNGEDPSSPQFLAVAARLKALVEMTADPTADGRYVRNVVFRGVTFRDADYAQKAAGGIGQGAAGVEAAVRLHGARDCRFERCCFEALGGFAAEVAGGSRDAAFSRCRFHDLGAGAICINGGTFDDHPAAQTRGTIVADCEIGDYGLQIASAVGVLVMHSSDNQILYNHIHDGYYTGISIGWRWGHGDSISARNRVEGNLVENIGKGLLNDMGGIYLLGHQPGTVIRGNVVRGVRSWSYGGHCLYADEGTQGVLIENNLLYDSPDVFNIHYARELTVRNNIFALSTASVMSGGSYEAHVTAYFHGNIFYWERGRLRGGTWRNTKGYDYSCAPFAPPVRRHDHNVADYNLFWCPTNNPEAFRAQWCEKGVNAHALWADPQFKNAHAGDFTLPEDSPARRIGFEPFDFRAVGPRRD